MEPAASTPARPSPFAFVDGALDRRDELRDQPEALADGWASSSVIVLDAAGAAATGSDGGLLRVAGEDLAGGPAGRTFLGVDGTGTRWFLDEAANVDAASWTGLRQAAAPWPTWQATLFAQARALQHWHQRYSYCPGCGTALRWARAGWLGICTGCGSEHFPRTDQAVIAAITDGRRLLLGRQASWPARRWSLVAGFVEPGETLEQALAREVMEETGVRVIAGSARYLASQPWPFPGSLMLGFIARAEPDPPRATEELEDARWFALEDVEAGLARQWDPVEAPDDGDDGGIILSSPISIARHVIAEWVREMRQSG